MWNILQAKITIATQTRNRFLEKLCSYAFFKRVPNDDDFRRITENFRVEYIVMKPSTPAIIIFCGKSYLVWGSEKNVSFYNDSKDVDDNAKTQTSVNGRHSKESDITLGLLPGESRVQHFSYCLSLISFSSLLMEH